MIILLKVWKWLKSYWYIPLLFIGALFIFIFVLKKPEKFPLALTLREVDAIQAQTRIKELEAEKGLEVAKAAVAEEYKAEMAALTYNQEAKAKELRDDPSKLAKFLVRAGSRSSAI